MCEKLSNGGSFCFNNLMELRHTEQRKRPDVFDPSTELSRSTRKKRKNICLGGQEEVDMIWHIPPDSFEVKGIVGHKKLPNARTLVGLAKYEYMIRWEGYSAAFDSWLPYENVQHLAAL